MTKKCYPTNGKRCIAKMSFKFAIMFLVLVASATMLQAATKTSAATGNWSAAATWSPSGVPASGDDVIIKGGHTVTVNGTYTCRNLNVGDAVASNATLTVSVGNTLTVTGDVQINPGNKANTFVLDAGAGTLNINGTFSYWSTTGTNSLRTAAGTLNITPAVTIANANQNVTYTGAGTINFYNSFTDSYNKLVTFAACVSNFYKNYTVNTTAASWAGKGTAVFKGTGYSISPTTALTLFNIQFDSTTTLNSSGGNVAVGGNLTVSNGATFTISPGSGTFVTTGNVTLGTSAVFTANKSIEIAGNWTNNGGTYNGGSYTTSFSGTTKTIGGTSTTAFNNLQFGVAATTASYTLNVNASCNNISFNNAAAARTLTLSNNDTLSVAGDLTINQSTGNFTNQLAVNGGACVVSGALTFTGTDNTATRIVKVGVTSGYFRVNGAVTWLSNTQVVTEQITVTTGIVIFGTSVSMGANTGTVTVTTGSIYFNGTTAPSFAFGGGATAPVFTTTGASNLYFAKGFTNNTSALTLSATSNAYFTGNGAITPNAAITFGNIQFNASAKDTLTAGSAVVVAGNLTLSSGSELKANQGFQVAGNWVNNGGALSASGQTVILNGTTKTISGTGVTAFPTLQIGTSAVTVSVTMNNNNTCENLVINSSTLARTLTLGVGDTLNVSGNLTINQATGNVTNQLAVNAGVCTVAGNVIFSGSDNTATRIVRVAVTTGSFTVNGTVTWLSNTVVATESFTVTTGTLTFGSSVTMGSNSGSIAVSSTGSIYFNGTTAPSLSFGGVATVPVLTTAAGCNLYFAKGFTNNTNALTLNATSTANFTGNGAITPNAAITFGHIAFGAGVTDTFASAAGAIVVKGDLTISSGATFTTFQSFQTEGNWSNNGGTFDSRTYTVTFNGLTKTIGGTSGTTFYNLQMGSTAVILNYTATRNITCNNLVFNATTTARTLTLSTGVTLTINGDLTINQPTGAVTNALAVGSGICTLAGNLLFVGTSNTTTRIARVGVTSGSFTINGAITWMANTAVATEVITTATGTLNFTNSVTMGSGSGTISVTGAGNINFNGTSAPCLSFGGATAPVFGSAYGSNINFNKGLTATTTALTFAVGSNQIFKGTATVTPTALITFGNFQINSGYTITMAGNVAVKGNWYNQGTFAPGTYTVTFNGTGTQTITRSGGETFYKMAATPFGTTLFLLNNVMVTNQLTMSGANIDLNSYTLTLGNSAGAALTYTLGQVYNGSLKRWFPASAITSTSGNYYGLFPIGTSIEYRPVTINSTVSPTTAGYVTVTHTPDNGGTNVTYTDNEGSNIEAIGNMHSDIATSGLAGGTYTLDVKFTDMGSTGSASNLKLLTYTGQVMGSCGTHVTTNGPVDMPTGHRSGLSVTNLNNAWIIGTNDRNATPMYTYLYSRKSGNWNDVTAGNGTWSYTAGGSGASCNCKPNSSAYATIEAGHTVTVSASDSVKFLDVLNGGALTIPVIRTLNVGGSMDMTGTGTFTVNGTLKVNNELSLSASTSPTVNGNVTVMGYFYLPAGASYTQSGGTLTVSGDMNISGSMSMASAASIVFDGLGSRLSGTGTFTTTTSDIFPITNNKLIMPGTAITFGTSGTNTAVSVGANTTVNNLGSLVINGNLTGASATTSIWINNANSAISATGSIFNTGILDASIIPNTVEYSGSGSQTINLPLTSYHTLKAANAGTKTLAGDMVVDGALVLGGSVVLDESTSIISGDGGLTMTGTSELKLQRATDISEYPELGGTYNCTGGTVTLNQTGDSCVVHAGQYYNLKLNGTRPYDLTGVNTISNNLDVLNSSYINDNTVLTIGGTFTYNTSGTSVLGDSIAVSSIVMSNGTILDGDNSINVFGSGGWTRASAATFTANEGTVYFTGGAAQTLGGTATSHTFNNLTINKSANTLTVGGSATSLNLVGDMNLNAGSFNKGTAANINMLSGNWNCNGGTFVPGTGTVSFTDTLDQAIQGTASSATFNNITVNNTGAKLAVDESVTTLSLSGNMLLTAGEFDAGTATTINMTAGNWTNNGATFTPAASNLVFNGSGAQTINGTAVSQNFASLTTNKSANTLSVGGSTTALALSGNNNIYAGTFNPATATTINIEGNWSMTGGSYTNTGNTVIFSGAATQNIASTGAFNNLQIANVISNVVLGSDVTVNGTLTFADGLIQTNAYKVIIPSTASISGADATSYVSGNLQMGIPNAAAPSRTFTIGDATGYAPVTVAFVGTTTGSGSVTAYTTTGDDADITNSGINDNLSVNRTWTLTNSGVGGFTSYSPTYTFSAGEVDGSANTANFDVSRYSAAAWHATTTGARTSTSTQVTGETTFGKAQIGEKNTFTIAVQPDDTTMCTGLSFNLVSKSTSVPAPTIKWQRDPNTGTFADITGVMDGSVYTGYTSDTLHISNAVGLGNYKYRAIFANVNGTRTSDTAALTVNTTPTITSTTADSICDLGTAILTATASAGSVNWYASATDTTIDYTGPSFTTPTISSDYTYYVSALSAGCTSPSRSQVTALVTPTPTIVTTTPAAICTPGTVGLAATASAGSVNWYAASSGGASLYTGTNYTTPSISVTTTYYANATQNGCTTASRTGVTATVSSIPTAIIAYQSCAGLDGNTTIQIGHVGGTAPFTYKLNSGSFNSYDTVHIHNASNQNYYVKDTYGCTSSATNYTATSIEPTRIANVGASSTCNCASHAEGREVYLTNSSGDLIAIMNDMGHDLGTITATVYTRDSSVLLPNNQGGYDAAMSRSFLLDFDGTNLTPAVEVKFPFTNLEYNNLVAASLATPIDGDDITQLSDLGSTQYEGPSEDGVYNTSGATMLTYHQQVASGNMLGGKYVTIALTANGEHWLHGNSNGSPLPVKLVSFDAVVNPAGTSVETKWITSLEIANDYYTVERSTDGINFNEVGRVDGAGTYTGTLNYRFNDVKPLNGVSYYRLKQTDFDGAYTYSNTVTVSLNNQISFMAYPNPNNGEFHLRLSNVSDVIRVSINDINGREMFNSTFDGNRAKGQDIAINAKEMLPAGIYMLTISADGNEVKQKMIINN